MDAVSGECGMLEAGETLSPRNSAPLELSQEPWLEKNCLYLDKIGVFAYFENWVLLLPMLLVGDIEYDESNADFDGAEFHGHAGGMLPSQGKNFKKIHAAGSTFILLKGREG